MTDFLLELRSEEIPARMQVKAKEDLARLFAEEIAKSGLVAARIEAFATPRRLALIAHGLPAETAAVSEERKGPRSNAPEAALAGFLRSTGLTREQLVERDGVFFAVIDKPGRPTADVLAEAIPAVIRAFPWPKSMRWGAASASTESLRWVRPLQGIVAILGEDIVPFDFEGLTSGAATLGHRFHHPGVITIGGAHDYVEKLSACHVIVHLSERTAIIRDGAARLASEAGLVLVEDEGLVVENAGLTEWPVPLLGSFDPAFLDVPPEVIQLTARVNQKYFVLRDAGGNLAPNFICTANIDASDGGKAVVAGNERVLSARLSDAKFFWENDLKVPLATQAAKLKDIVFHEKLGTVADKVERVAKLARWLVEEGIVNSSPERGGGPRSGGGAAIHNSVDAGGERPLRQPDGLPPPRSGEDLATLAETAARLCKADLVTGMVGEFPELQGIIGGHLARAQGQPDAVADAIRDHYKPVGQGDDVPVDPVTVAVSLADKLDTICQFFRIGQMPTGSKDPFALRRSALGVISLIDTNSVRLPLHKVMEREFVGHIDYGAGTLLMDFLVERLKVQQRDRGVRADIVDAIFARTTEDDLVRLLARVKALQAFVGTAEGADLLAGYKRAANILKKEGVASTSDRHPELVSGSTPPPKTPSQVEEGMLKQVQHDGAIGNSGTQKPLSYTPEPCEADLIAALDAAEPRAAAAIAAEDFEVAMTALASLRGPIDAFFDNVTVNDPDADKRAARLTLLAQFRDAVHSVADFSKIEG